jgi:chemotaxis response regulator CheB
MRAAEFLRSLADMIDALDNPSADRSHDAEEKDPNPVMVTPLQQHLELDKAEQGKDSPVIQQLTRSEH